jgi:D-sedoheptulose 7-phosphate isomerase
MKDQFDQHIKVVQQAVEQIPALEAMADRLIACFNAGGRLYLVGNGGSAADAQHIAAELIGRFKVKRKALPAVALTTDTSTLTAISNDWEYEYVFARQVEALVTSGDILWALSVSGTSPNVLRAVETARKIGASVIGFTGKSGDPLANASDIVFRADHTDSDRVQEAHLLAYHLICDKVEKHFATCE